MKTYQFVVPAHVPREAFEQALCLRFGGFTSTAGRGGWLDEKGEVDAGDLRVYQVSISELRPSKYNSLLLFVKMTLERHGEKVAYIGEIGRHALIPL